ncbi:hypothetical protein CYMTET_50868 [Cymbomonas tetramitiformis]|uniref:Uncharacterized protein n=1 Tax=Cymbomonas tetramitiformis TaxID=36881 RepID=A0AAE0BNC8_9CHLO|nr:hypothetical protein CYMTET_50868 [Cymbomonas tetramitiformis]
MRKEEPMGPLQLVETQSRCEGRKQSERDKGERATCRGARRDEMFHGREANGEGAKANEPSTTCERKKKKPDGARGRDARGESKVSATRESVRHAVERGETRCSTEEKPMVKGRKRTNRQRPAREKRRSPMEQEGRDDVEKGRELEVGVGNLCEKERDAHNKQKAKEPVTRTTRCERKRRWDRCSW